MIHDDVAGIPGAGQCVTPNEKTNKLQQEKKQYEFKKDQEKKNNNEVQSYVTGVSLSTSWSRWLHSSTTAQAAKMRPN